MKRSLLPHLKGWITYSFIFIFILVSYLASAQQNTADSLLLALKTARQVCPEPCIGDSTIVIALNALSKQYSNTGNYNLAMQYANEAIAIINKTNTNLPGRKRWMGILADSYINLGIIHEHQGKSAEALQWYTKSIRIYEGICGQTRKPSEEKCRKALAASYNNVGRIHSDQSNNTEALLWFTKSLKIMEEINDREGMANAYGNIGITHNDQGNTAFDHGDMRTMEKEYLEAFNWYTKSLLTEKEINDLRGMAISYNNIGFLLADVFQKDTNAFVLIDKKPIGRLELLDSALVCQIRSYALSKKMLDKPGMAYSLNGIGRINLQKKLFNQALHSFQEALLLAKEIGEAMPQEDAHMGSYEALKALGRYKEALTYYEKYITLHDTAQSEENLKNSLGQHYEYQYEKQMQALQLEQEKKDAISNAEKQNEVVFRNSFIGGFSLLLILAIVVLTGYRNKIKTNKVLETLNKELEKLSIVASETDNGVLICGPDGEIEWSNPGLTRLLGYTFEELKQQGNTIEKLSSNPDIKLLIRQSIKDKKSSTYQALNITKDGKERWMQSTLTPILDDAGNIKKLVIIDTDISDRKKIEKKLNEQNQGLEQSQKDISILSDIGLEIASSLSVEKIIEKTYENINRLMEASVFFIGIYDAKKNQLSFPGAMEKGVKFSAVFYDLDDNSRPAVWCFKNQKEIIMNDLLQEYNIYFPNTPVPEPIAGETPESLVYIPLTIQDKRIGVISVQSFNKKAYSKYHISIVRNLAVYVAIALENAQLYESLEDKVEERTLELVKGKEEIEKTYNNIQILSEIGQEITSTLNLEKVLDTVYKKVNSLMDATEFGIGIYNQQKQSIDFSNYYYESKRMDSDLDTWVSMEDKNRLSVWCAENKKAVFINDIQNEYGNYISNLDSYKGEGKLLLKSVICLPLIIEEKLVGLISVQSPHKNAYTQNHLEILQTLASYIAIALDNARLYDTMEGEVKARTAEIEKQKTLVEEKNLKITDSIYYAQRIQQAILPSQEMIRAILPNSFIFFQPKDIVSGDFYWAYAIPSPHGERNEVLYAAVDCTGHGVPGAFMSIMGYNLLEQIVSDNKIYQPALILSELSKLVVDSLKQTDEIGTIKEGMDIALCKIDYKNMELEYAGAHNSLNLIRNGILTETKANQRSIGISLTRSDQFYNHKIKLEKGDCFYIFSDGYADQFGGEDNQKFFYLPFRELLVDIHQLSMEKQQKELEKVITQWKGDREQTDDMLVIGVRI